MGLREKILKKRRYGMVGLMIQGNLAKIGLKIAPYILFEESRSLYENGGPDGKREEEPKPRVEPLEPGFLEPTEIPALAALPDYEYTEQQLQQRVDTGNKCFSLKHQGQVAAFVWCNFHECLHPPLRFPLHEGEAYFYDAFTVEGFRGKALSPYIRYQLYKFSEQYGRNKAFSVADYYNTPAVRAQQRMNAKPLQLYFYAKLFGKFSVNKLLKEYTKDLPAALS